MKEENSDNQLKDLFKGKFADEYLAPPKGAWSNIQGQMAAPGRIRKPLYYWLIPVGLLFIIGGGIAVNSVFSTEKAQTSSITTEEKIQDDLKENEENSTSDNKEVNSNEVIETKSNESETLVDKVAVDGTENIKDDQKAASSKGISAEQKNISSTSKTILANSVNEKNKTLTKSDKNAEKTSRTKDSDNSVVANNSKPTTTAPALSKEKTLNSKDPVPSTEKAVKADRIAQSTQEAKENKVSDTKPETKIVDAKIENDGKSTSATADRTTEKVVVDPTKSESNLSTEVKTNEEKSTIKEVPNVLNNETVAETKETKESKTKVLNKEAEAGKSDEKTTDGAVTKSEEKKAPEPAVTESNILLKSVAPRNNLRYDFYLGKGTSPRRSTFYGANVDNPAILLADKSVNMKNTVIGFNVRYQITPYFGMRSGIAGGGDRIQSRLFSVKLANTDLDQNMKIATVDGILQTTGLANDKLSANGTDSSTYDMQILHRQGYLTIPISFVVNTKIQPGKLYYYGSTGFDFMAKGKGRNLLTVKDGEESRDINLNRISDVNRIYTNWNISLGLAYPFKSRFDLFTEINYSLDISKRLKSSYLITNSAHLQVLLGLRF